VVIVAPAAALTAAGARVALVRPDRAAIRTIRRNVLDMSRLAAARADRAQAAAEAPTVQAVCQPDPGQPRGPE
jgi:NTE family protein